MNQKQVTERAGAQVRWNLFALMLDVSFFSIGMAFTDGNAVLPLLLKRLGGSALLIGAFGTLHYLAFNGFQIVVAWGTHGRPRQKPFLALIAAVTRLPLLSLPYFIYHATDSPAAQRSALIALVVLMTFWALGDGLGYVPWMEIVARAFTDKVRGRFFATTQLVSGLISIVIAAFLVRGVLASPHFPYPHNYALLTLVAALMFQVSLTGVLLIREPPFPPSAVQPHIPLLLYFRRLPGLVRSNPEFARLAGIQLLIGFGSAAAPFYVLFALQRFHLPDAWGGIYQTAQAVGVVTLMPLWTYLSEKRNPATAVRALAVGCLLTPILAMTVGALSPWLFALVFLLMGGTLGWGMWIVLNHYLLSHVEEGERPVFIALMNLLFVPSAFYPSLGSFFVLHDRFVTLTGIPVLFLLTALVVSTGLILAMRLPAPSNT
ncbi:MAG: transporter, major facilitator family [Chthonomonadaceae bacterium]|nr:transporter, major facilitator family [Chthonomonadaceae bacterium]